MPLFFLYDASLRVVTWSGSRHIMLFGGKNRISRTGEEHDGFCAYRNNFYARSLIYLFHSFPLSLLFDLFALRVINMFAVADIQLVIEKHFLTHVLFALHYVNVGW